MSASSAPTPSLAPCRLCGDLGRLIQGHVIPQFVYRAHFFATASERDRRVHDGPTRPMLCRRCESDFSRHESEFARELFHPFRRSREVRVTYRAWLRKFAASVCWRILETTLSEAPSAFWLARWSNEIAATRAVWRDFLSGRRTDVAAHHLHFIAWSPDSETGTERKEITMELVGDERDAFVVAGLGEMIFVGVIQESEPAAWQGTRLHAEGRVKPRDCAMPRRVRAHLLAGG